MSINFLALEHCGHFLTAMSQYFNKIQTFMTKEVLRENSMN